MAEYDFDLLVIGAGSGGVRASRMAAKYGARVAVAEQQKLGGTCVNVGCIPKKLLVYASHFADDFEDATGFGWSGPKQTFDWSALIANKDKEIARLNAVYGRLLDEAGVKVLDGHASFVDAHTVEVAGTTYRAKYILIAAGGRPFKPTIPGIEHAIVSDQAFYLPALPKRVAVGGGGYIGVEFAGVFRGLGAEVTLIHRGDMFLRGFDDAIRRGLAEEMKARGITLRFGATIDSVDRAGSGPLSLNLSDGATLEVDSLLCAMGRIPYTEGLGLEKAGVAIRASDGAVEIDAYSRTNVENIYAVGDITNRIALTPMAIAEGAAVAETLFHDNPTKPDHHQVPSAIFSHPPIGTVGLTQAEAEAQCADLAVYESRFTPLKNQLTTRKEKTLMRLYVDRKSDRVLGCHVLGPDAGEIIQGFAVAIRCGATKAQFDATVGIHPTAAEELVTMRSPLPSS